MSTNDAVVRFPYALPRTAFSPREAARAGDVWRAFQDIAVEAATRKGWSPMRMRASGSIWVVRSMTVLHAHETMFGEPLEGASWVRRTRRGMLSTREVRLYDSAGLVAAGSQEWAHLGVAGLCRMPQSMEDDLGLFDEGGVDLPSHTPKEGASFGFEFEVWETWSDPVGHVNHPQYVDFCDESVSRHMRERGVDPLVLVPVAETVTFRAELKPRDRVRVSSKLVGVTASGDLVFEHVIGTEATPRAADARTVRRTLNANPDHEHVFR